MTKGTGVVVGAGDGEDLWFAGGLVTFKVTAEQSAGSVVMLEDNMPRGKTTPLHVHETYDETVYVLEGELLVHIDGKEHTAGAGSIAAFLRGVPHAFLVTSEHARVLVIATPGEVFEDFFRRGGDVPTSRDATPPPIDIAKLKAAGEATGGMQVLGPPPFAAVAAHG